MMAEWTLTTMFDRPYSPEKMAEGRAISWAIATGACNSCEHLQRCSTDDRFAFPADAACMKKKTELLEEQSDG